MPRRPATPAPVKAKRGKGARTLSKPAPRVAGLPTTKGTIANTNDSVTKAVISPDALFGRISYSAGPNLTRYSTYPATNLQPEAINAALRQRDLGYPWIWAEMGEQVLERDGHLGGIDDSRRKEVSGKPFRVQPNNETPLSASVAKFVRSCIDEVESFDRAMEFLLGANPMGYSATEMVWKELPVRFPLPSGSHATISALVPYKLEWVHGKHFRFDAVTDEPFLVIGGDNESLPDHKFIFHTGEGSNPIVERRGWMSACVWLHAAKQWSVRDWIVYQHIFGLPFIQGKYTGDQEQYEAHRDLYEAILKDYGQGIPALTTSEFSVEMSRDAGGGRTGDVHSALIGYCNAEMSKRVLGSTLTVEMAQTGSYNASETHADVKHGKIKADARHLAETLRRQLFRSIIDLNANRLATATGHTPDEIRACLPFGSWRIERETTPEVRSRIFTTAINEWRLHVDEDQLRDEFGLDAPRPGSKPVAGKLELVKTDERPVDTVTAHNQTAPTEATPTAAAGAGDAGTTSAHVELTPSDAAGIVTVREARASFGLPPFGDERDDMTITEYTAKNAATVAQAAAAQEGEKAAPATDSTNRDATAPPSETSNG